MNNNYEKIKSDYSKILFNPEESIVNIKDDNKVVSESVGYTAEELESIPKEANVALGCGNPLRRAKLEEGEYVVDLGSGLGIDCFLAANVVGEKGHVTGVDMNDDMIYKARNIAADNGYKNIDFRLGVIEDLPLESNTADCCISNCVINLSDDKEQVYREIFRVLKPGGRISICDIVIMNELPDDIKENPDMHSCWVSGASSVEELEVLLKEVGFENVFVETKQVSKEYEEKWGNELSVGEYIMSSYILGNKPKSI